jgi:hypothetical protein
MVGRVLIGKRGSDYGLFISQKDVEVTNTALTTSLSFDSRSVRGMVIHAKGEGSLAAPTGIDEYASTSVTISHGLGYKPLHAVRWCKPAHLSGGVATRMLSPNDRHTIDVDFSGDEEPDIWAVYTGEGCATSISTSNLTITNYCSGDSLECEEGDCPTEYTNVNNSIIYYAYIIFKAKDTTGGVGL